METTESNMNNNDFDNNQMINIGGGETSLHHHRNATK